MEETTNSPASQPSSGGMNWKVIIGIIIAILVIAFVAFGMSGKSDDTDTETGTETSSLKNLLAMGGSQKCVVTYKNDTTESTGEVFISNGMMRGNFTMMANGQTMANHMIVKSDTSYVWSDGVTQGIMMKFGEVPTGDAPQGQQAIDVNQEYGYDCDDWSEDASVFETPASVNFVDMQAMMQGQVPAGMMPGY